MMRRDLVDIMDALADAGVSCSSVIEGIRTIAAERDALRGALAAIHAECQTWADPPAAYARVHTIALDAVDPLPW